MISFKENVGSANYHKMHMRLTDRSDHQIGEFMMETVRGLHSNDLKEILILKSQ